jgi:hypothetical protein
VQETTNKAVAIKTTKRRMNPPVSIFNVFALCRATLAGAPPRLARQDCTGPVILASRQPSRGKAQIPPG